jgi:dinuclear metal center YbgI/SA1388 family protein
MKLFQLTAYLEERFPLNLQEDYDNSGLQLGDPSMDITSVLVALDCTEAIVEEAIQTGSNVIVVHHPILFKGIKRIGVSTEIERILHRCIKQDIAIYAIHTNLDNHIDGVNSKIASTIGLRQCRILQPKPHTLFKLVIYTPVDSEERVHDAVCAAGAGNIGNYYNCGYTTVGIGKFTPNEKANPSIGEAHVPTKQEEAKMEYLLEKNNIGPVLSAMKGAHPYEEVAYDLIALENSNAQIGSGMIGELPEPMDALEFLSQLKEAFNCGLIRYTALQNKPIRTVALCGGAGSFLLPQAIQQNADIFISGDFKYHEFFGAENKIIIADIGHYESEQYTSALLVEIIREKFPTFAVRLTVNNTNPINFL